MFQLISNASQVDWSLLLVVFDLDNCLGPLLLTWINFDLRMEK